MDDTFLTFHRVLSIAGIPFFAKKHWSSKPWLLLQIFNFVISGLGFIFTTVFVATNYSDSHVFIQAACAWTTGIIMPISLGVCLIFRNHFRNFLEEMVFKDAMLEMPLINHILLVRSGGEKIAELRDLVFGTQERVFKYTRVLLKTYLASVSFNATLYLCSPIYQMIVQEDKSLRLLAYEMWFPWSLKNYTVYIVAFIFNAYIGYLCCIAYAGLQVTIILLNGQVIRHIRILTFILLHMNELVLEITGIQDDRWQACCTLALSQCIVHYVKIKRFSNRVNVICRLFYLALILVAIMLVCMCSVKIATSNKLSFEMIKFYGEGLCITLVVFMFYLMGQKVEDECEELENAVTEKWYIFNRAHKTNVLIFSMALRQGMPIYLFGTIQLSLPTFTWSMVVVICCYVVGIRDIFVQICVFNACVVMYLFRWSFELKSMTIIQFIKTGMSFFTLLMSVLEEE